MMDLNERMEMLREKLNENDMISEVVSRYGYDEPFLLIEIAAEEDKIRKFCKEIANIEDLNEFTEDNYGYSDEYLICEDCGIAFQNPKWDYNYYKEGIIFEGEFEAVCCCENCLKEFHIEEYINSCINDPKTWITMYSKEELSNLGWTPVNENEYEYGMYGVCDNPLKILEKYQEKDKNYLFVRTNENPFAQQFILMVKDKEEE